MSDANANAERKRTFAVAIRTLMAAYGREAGPPELRAWWALLGGYPDAAIAAACDRAMREGDGRHPPTAEQVRRHVAAIHAAGARATLDAKRVAERPALPPGPIAGKAARIMATDDPWEALARLWEAEDAHAGRGPYVTTPQAAGTRRWADFWATWDKPPRRPPQRTETGLESTLAAEGEQATQAGAAQAPGAKSDD